METRTLELTHDQLSMLSAALITQMLDWEKQARDCRECGLSREAERTDQWIAEARKLLRII